MIEPSISDASESRFKIKKYIFQYPYIQPNQEIIIKNKSIYLSLRSVRHIVGS